MADSYSIGFLNSAFLQGIHMEERFCIFLIRQAQHMCIVQKLNQIVVGIQAVFF